MNNVSEGIDPRAAVVDDETKVTCSWTVVQKLKRARKHKFETTKEVKEVENIGPAGKSKDHISGMGSRLIALGDETIVTEQEKEIEINLPRMDIEDKNQYEEVQLVENLDDNKVNEGKRKDKRALLNTSEKQIAVNNGDPKNLQKEW